MCVPVWRRRASENRLPGAIASTLRLVQMRSWILEPSMEGSERRPVRFRGARTRGYGGSPSWNSAALGEGDMGDERYSTQTPRESWMEAVGRSIYALYFCRMDEHLVT